MIKDVGGRLHSERTPEEIGDILKKDIAGLTPAEKEAFLLLLKELGDPAIRSVEQAAETGGPISIMDALAEGEYKRRPVDIRTFVTDPYYLGETCAGLYPKLLEDMIELFEGGYKEAVLTGSIGWGKTFFASIAVCRCLYEISCLRDPHKSFGIASGTGIAFVALSVSESLAIKVVFENIANKLERSPYFQEHFPYEATKKELRFPNNVWVAARASTDSAALGLNVFGAVMDEGNFFEPIRSGSAATTKWGNKDKAQQLYDQLVRRMKSRFMKGGKLPGLMIVVSSKRTKEDFTAKRVREAKDDPDIFVRDYAMYDVKPDSYTRGRFTVLVGNETTPSKILREEEISILRSKLQDGLVLIEVPEDYRKDFENDLDGSIRDIAGCETVSISPFIQQRDKLVSCIDKNRQHPFTVESWDQTEGGEFIWERLARMTKIRDGAELYDGWQPLHYPGITRHVHIDPSIVGDATGFAMGCVIGYKNVTRRHIDTDEQYEEPAPVIWVDFMLRVVPPIGGEIDQSMIRGLVYKSQQHGFPVGYASMDQYNSASSLQKFAVKGIEAERISVDKPMDAYDTLKSAIYEGRVLMYNYEPVLRELRALQKDNVKNKVDHPRLGSKDVADALAGIVFTLTTKYRGGPMPIVRGISTYGDPTTDTDADDGDSMDFLMPFLTG